MQSRSVLITGASRGIGRAAAIRFAQDGFNVAMCCRSRTGELEETAALLRKQYHVQTLCFTGDAGSYQDMERFCRLAQETFGRIDVLVNNAGISWIGLLTDMTPEDWDSVIRTNLTSVFNTCRLLIPDMVRCKAGHIVNVSSVWGVCGASCEAAYSASKGGINALTQALAKELAPSGIAVNAIACGTIDTDMNACFSPEERAQLEEEIPAGRYGTPEEAAELIFRLAVCSPYLTGQIVRLDGGWI